DEVLDVAADAGEEIIDADDIALPGDQPLAQVRAEKPGTAGDQNAFFQMHQRRSMTVSGILRTSRNSTPPQNPNAIISNSRPQSCPPRCAVRWAKARRYLGDGHDLSLCGAKDSGEGA